MGAHHSTGAGANVAKPKITVTTTGIKVTPSTRKARGAKAKGKAQGAKARGGKSQGAKAKGKTQGAKAKGKAQGAKARSGKSQGAKAKGGNSKANSSGRQPIPRKIRYEVWAQYYQEKEEGICYCCGVAIRHRGWHCAHVISDAKGGPTTAENLRPTCRHCNLSMGNQNLYAYICQKRLRGPGRRHAEAYFAQYPEQRHDKRTNNWGRKT